MLIVSERAYSKVFLPGSIWLPKNKRAALGGGELSLGECPAALVT